MSKPIWVEDPVKKTTGIGNPEDGPFTVLQVGEAIRLYHREEQEAHRLAWVEYYVATELWDRTLPGTWSARSPNTWQPDQRRQVIGDRGKLVSALAASSQHAMERVRRLPQSVRENRAAKWAALDFVEQNLTQEMTQAEAQLMLQRERR